MMMADMELDDTSSRMLLADWFVRLARETGLSFDKRGSRGSEYILTDPSAFKVIAKFTQTPPFLDFNASDPSRQDVVNAIVARAVSHVQRLDLGGIAWYSTKLREIEVKPSPFSLIGSFLDRLDRQTRIAGWRRLGSNILLEFIEDVAEGRADENAFLAPKTTVHVHIAAPGPCAGFFSSQVANNVLETVGAVCTFALGRLVELPPTVFPSKPDELVQLKKHRTDADIRTLTRKNIPLDIFSIGAPGGRELFQRVGAAMITFDDALRQDRGSTACILFVVAAECLTAPYTKWRHEKLTNRFIKFFDELIPTHLDQIVGHGNFEEAFGIRRGQRTARALRRELLDLMYDYRSGQLHRGLSRSYQGLGAGFDAAPDARRGLFGDFAEAAILQYLAAPRCSLIGHPAFE